MLTEQQMRDEYLDVMGSGLGQWFYELDKDFDWLQRKWSMFRDLFESGEERLEMLNATAPNFFFTLRQMLFENAMLHLCRLTDPPKTGRFENMTIMGISQEITDMALKAAVEDAAKRAQLGCEFARIWRDKWIAHYDLPSSRSGHAGFPAVGPNNIAESISLVQRPVNLIREHFHLPLEITIADPSGARSLIHFLEIGLHASDDSLS